MKKHRNISRILSVLLCASITLECLAGIQSPARVTAAEASPEPSSEVKPVAAPEGTVTSDDGKWDFSPYENGVQITAYYGSAIDVCIPTEVEKDGITYPVLKLGDRLFENNDSLNSVTLGEGILKIGNKAFYDCDNLVCIVTNQTLTTIGAEAFYHCDIFNSVVLYSTVTSIGKDAFAQCPKLTIWCDANSDVYFYAYANSIPFIFLEADAVIKTVTVNNIDYVLFNGTASAVKANQVGSSVVIPSVVNGYPVTELKSSLFYCRTAITNIVLPETLKVIGDEVFVATQITSLTIPSGVTEIGDEIFSSCHHLKQVTIPSSVTVMGDNIFNNTGRLTYVIVCEGSYALDYAKNNKLPYYVLGYSENPEIYFGSSISGTVSYMDGTPAVGITVTISYDDGELKNTVISDTNGLYEFAYVEVGTYTICVTDENGNTASAQISVKRMNAFEVFVVGDLDLRLKKGWTVSGTVSGNSATVKITDLDGNILNSVETSDCNFSFTSIPNGTYIITASTQSGSVSQEITVFDGNLSQIVLTAPETSVTLWGYVEVENRSCESHRRNWVDVTVYNAAGLAVAQCKSDMEGKYIFPNLPAGQYFLVAQIAEMRPDWEHGFDRSYNLTGFTRMNVAEVGTYQADTIVLREEHDGNATISGKVTAHGQTQISEVILSDVFDNQVAKYVTKNNGKYNFANVADGVYFVTAITESDGMGYVVVIVLDGIVYGERNITVLKSDKIQAHEIKFNREVPVLSKQDETPAYAQRIIEEKQFYDSLSEKEKKQLSEDYVQRLNQYVEWLANISYDTDEGVTVQQGGLIVSSSELENECEVSYIVRVEKTEGHTASTDGVNSKDDFIHHTEKDAAGKHKIKQRYEITVTKMVDGKEQQITSVHKNTNATGRFRITLDIPEEYRGHRHYSILHEHHGEIVRLADLDDDPNTITIEVDAFSAFTLTATDEFLTTEDVPLFDLAGTNLRLGEDLTIFFYVNKSDLSDTDYYAQIRRTYSDGTPDEIITIPYSAWESYNDSLMRFGYEGLPAAAMADELYITICKTDGTAASREKEDSIQMYAMRQIGGANTSAKVNTLLVDMLNYGAAAQEFFKYNTAELANADLTETQQELYATKTADAVDCRVKGTNYIGSTLILANRIEFTFYFSNLSRDMYAVVEYTDIYNTLQKFTIPGSDFITNSGYLGVNINGLPAGDGKQLISCTVYDKNGNSIADAKDSVEGYIARMSAQDKLYTMVMRFVVSSKAYFEK